jgi:hypothetical protein
MLQKLDTWHKTKQGLFVFGLIELIAAYILASLAINSGSLLQWGLAIILLLGSLQNGFKLIMRMFKKG